MFWPLGPAAIVRDETAIMLAGMLPLAGILYGAVRAGLRERRIPNQLVLIGMAAGVLLHSVLPDGNGFLEHWPGGVGPWQSLRGVVTGAAAMFPFYRMKAIGAGDLKLMGAVGAILGPWDVVPAILGTLLAGGALALAVTVRRRCTGQMLSNMKAMLHKAFGRENEPNAGIGAARSVAETPYVVAVAIGTLGGVLWVLRGATTG